MAAKKTRIKMGRIYRYKGRKYTSIAALARFCRINYRTLKCRLDKGIPVNQAVKKGRIGNGKNEPKQIIYKGKKYLSLRSLADAFQIGYSALRGRISRGYSIKEAVEAGVSAHEVTVGGRRYKNLATACRKFGFNEQTIRSRLRYNWTLDQAFELEPPPFLGSGIAGLVYKITNSINDKVYIGQTKATAEDRWKWHLDQVKRGGSNPDGLHHAIKLHGSECFTITILERCGDLRELAAREREYIKEYNSIAPNGYNIGKGGEGLRSVGIAVVVRGKKFESLASAARFFKINYGTVCDRIDNGWSIEEALITPAKQIKGYVIFGVHYKSRTAVARHFKMSVDTIRHREREGIPIEEIVKKPKRSYREEPVSCCSKSFESKAAFSSWLGIEGGSLSYQLKRHPNATSICKYYGKCIKKK
jgi:hypothetical protein